MRLIIISGRSGSGKSTALHVLEDNGYYCIDNLPASLLPSLVAETVHSQSPEHQLLAVCIDARNSRSNLASFPRHLAELPAEVDCQVVYLDADDATLVKRFSETRRRHPLTDRGTALQEALLREGEILRPIADSASLTVDTRDMSFHDLREYIANTLAAWQTRSMVLLFQSFGFKRGVPSNADFVFDLRVLPNPHWQPELRPLTGLDPPVREFLERQPGCERMFRDITRFLQDWLPGFSDNKRAYTTVALGCTGGRHRSVYMAERLQKHFAGRFNDVQVRHRDLAANEQ